jgi:hypothetical protein
VSKKIVNYGGHAVDPSQVAELSKLSFNADVTPRYEVALHLASGTAAAFLAFDDEETRDKFFDAVVEVMGA